MNLLIFLGLLNPLKKPTSHLVRNFYITIIFYILISTTTGYILSSKSLLHAAITMTIVYSPVYFLNDYFDSQEDRKMGKMNLFLLFGSNPYFLKIILISIFTILIVALLSNPTIFLLLIFMYLLNYLYSAPPFSFRNKIKVRAIIIFLIYLIKGVLVMQLLDWPSFDHLLVASNLLIIHSALGAFGITLYKRYQSFDGKVAIITASIIIAFTFYLIWQVPSLSIFVLPVPLILFLVSFYWQKTQFPFAVIEQVYFIYAIGVFLSQK